MTPELVGRQFTRWTVMAVAPSRKFPSGGSKSCMICKCECGIVREVLSSDLIRGHSQSCGCYKRDTTGPLRRRDITGQQFHRWTALEPAPRRDFPSGTTTTYWICRCECGAVREVSMSNLVSGHSQSCGCYKREASATRRLVERCSRGHKRTPSSTYVSKDGRMHCRICRQKTTAVKRNEPGAKERQAQAHAAWYRTHSEERRRKHALKMATESPEERRYRLEQGGKRSKRVAKSYPSPLGRRLYTPEEDAIIGRDDMMLEGICAQLRANGTPRSYGAVACRRNQLRNGRVSDHPNQGELNYCAKLTEQDVREIRASPLPLTQLALIYGISANRCSKVKRRQCWKHVV